MDIAYLRRTLWTEHLNLASTETHLLRIIFWLGTFSDWLSVCASGRFGGGGGLDGRTILKNATAPSV